MKIIIKAKKLQWRRSFRDGLRIWEATLFNGQVRYMIGNNPSKPDQYNIHIGQDFKGIFPSFDDAKSALQADFEEQLSKFLKVQMI